MRVSEREAAVTGHGSTQAQQRAQHEYRHQGKPKRAELHRHMPQPHLWRATRLGVGLGLQYADEGWGVTVASPYVQYGGCPGRT